MLLEHHLAQIDDPVTVHRAPSGEDVRLFAAMTARRGGVHLYAAPGEREAREALAVASFFQPDLSVIFLPPWDCPPYDRISPSPSVLAARCAALTRMVSRDPASPMLVVTTATALVQRVPGPEYFRSSGLRLAENDTRGIDVVRQFLDTNGYSRTAIVREPGEYAIRGGIVDLFPGGESDPIRLDYFGDELERIRSFDPDSQRSTHDLQELVLTGISELDYSEAGLSRLRLNYLAEFGPPAGDPDYESARAGVRRQGLEHWLPLFHEALATLHDFLGPGGVCGFGPGAERAAMDRIELAQNAYATRLEFAASARPTKLLSPGSLYMTAEELDGVFSGRTIHFEESDAPEGDGRLFAGGNAARDFAAERVDPNVDLFSAVSAYLSEISKGKKLAILTAASQGSLERFRGFIEDHSDVATALVQQHEDCRPGLVNLACLSVSHGFENERLVLLTESDVLGQRLARAKRRRSATAFIAEAAAMNVGDLVVHIQHGVGRYMGLAAIAVGSVEHDCLELHYAGGDKVLLPVENAELVTRYGAESGDSALDRLGGASWQSRKARARKKIMEMAEELIALAAERSLRQAAKVLDSDGMLADFSARFPYEETDDQAAAIDDVVADLAAGKPMDRLVCGDVGFGKTEVALRAAFMAASMGMQVAVIAPTTLLARQHMRTFEERFAGWPLRLRQLSRFVSSSDAAKVREELANGQCDIVIGTHALLSERVAFKRLGLLVVDEEQRFGVKHKERLKELRSDVHVLTMTATPIPRTLQMSLAGIRDLSIIATPPVDRLSVRTFVVDFDEVTIREALLREHFRGGQSYFVVPRVSDLPFVERFLKEMTPELRVITAHGKMSGAELEEAMGEFYDGRADVLLATTIVESGLDVPRANTLIVHRADMFGLAQLYQLRGRVGRSRVRAYAYLTTPEDGVLTESASKRLKVLHSLDSLGAGFLLASHDLDMRGGGNLLGDAQSGHVREVGVELYQSMLEDAINAQRAGGDPIREEWSPLIDVGVSVRIPETYVGDLSSRLSLYRRFASVESEDDLELLVEELMDRFGPLPDETARLLEISTLKVCCKKLGIGKVNAGPKGAVFSFREDTIVDPDTAIAFVHSRPGQLSLRPDAKLVAKGVWPEEGARTRAIIGLTRELLKLAAPQKEETGSDS